MVSLFDKECFKKLNNNWLFEYFVVILYILLGAGAWFYSYSIFGFSSVLLTLLLILVFNDFKYAIPATLMVIFSYNSAYLSEELPVSIVAVGGSLVAVLLIYAIVNFKLSNFKKPKSFLGILLLAISCIIPIFWNKVITYEIRMLYLMYFSWVLYIALYFVFGINLKKSLRIAIFSFSLLALLITSQCAYQVIKMHIEDPDASILALDYAVGWGINNEAGIMLCFCMPFIAYKIIKNKNSLFSAIFIIELFAAMVGVILTNSRGALLFASAEFAAFFILIAIFSKKRITNIVFMLLFIALAILYVHLNYGILQFIEDIKNVIFERKFNYSDRKELWDRALALWKTDTKTVIFGSGIVSEVEYRWSLGTYDTVFIVYHSTFFEILAVGGIFGITALAIHFFEKYKQLWKKDLAFLLVMLTGFLAVDVYGMIDNTYGMYYYMIPLVILMASLDNDKDTEVFN